MWPPRATLRLALWLALGRIKDRHTLIRGLAQVPAALKGLFDGDNIGKLIVQVAE
jgi:NADPH-dependent curcumin reductase CurA